MAYMMKPLLPIALPSLQPNSPPSYTDLALIKKLQTGLSFADRYVRPSFGPLGRPALFKTGENDTQVTREGSAILSLIGDLDDQRGTLSSEFALQAALDTCLIAGDGSKSTIIIANYLVAEILKAIPTHKCAFVVRGVQKAIKSLVAELKLVSTKVDDPRQLAAVARLSSRGDLEVREVVADILNRGGLLFVDEVKKEEKPAIVKAINAMKAAVDEGIVVGGGCALLRLASKVDDIPLLNGGEKVGAEIVKNALKCQLALIAFNATECDAVSDKVLVQVLSSDNPNYGFNAETRVFEDLMAAGIIEPTKVIRCILENALDVAQKVVMTGSSIVEEEDSYELDLYTTTATYSVIRLLTKNPSILLITAALQFLVKNPSWFKLP